MRDKAPGHDRQELRTNLERQMENDRTQITQKVRFIIEILSNQGRSFLDINSGQKDSQTTWFIC